jgi:mono/diheme cytochrome c family protein
LSSTSPGVLAAVVSHGPRQSFDGEILSKLIAAASASLDSDQAYLRSVRPEAASPVSPPPAMREVASQSDLGRRIFEGDCTGCHLMNGEGRQTPYAALAGSAAVQDPKGVNITEVLLNGADARAMHPIVAIPAFATGLNNEELAALANFTIEHFGRRPGNVSAKDIEHARAN